MYGNDEKKFYELRSQFFTELNELETKIEELTERRNALLNLLDGSVGDADFEEKVEEKVEENVVEDEATWREDFLLTFLFNNPGSAKVDIRDVFNKHPRDTSEQDLKRLLESMKRRGLIVNEGRGRGSIWYATEQ